MGDDSMPGWTGAGVEGLPRLRGPKYFYFLRNASGHFRYAKVEPRCHQSCALQNLHRERPLGTRAEHCRRGKGNRDGS